jgi:acyl-CoA thioesterase-1
MAEDKKAASAHCPDRARAHSSRYGGSDTNFKHLARKFACAAMAAVIALLCPEPAAADSRTGPIRIVAFGDSLTAGYNLASDEAFPARLERALVAAGLDVEVRNGGVSGDTSAGALARLDWAVPAEADAVIVEFGANDALRGVDPVETRANLDSLISTLRARNQDVLVAGMLAPPNMGREYETAFNEIFPALAQSHDAVFYPFFLDGVAAQPRLNQGDGMHPTAAGVDVIVERILPSVIELVGRAKARRGQS